MWCNTERKAPRPRPPIHSSHTLFIHIIYQTALKPRAGNSHSLITVSMTKGWWGSDMREGLAELAISDQIIRYGAQDLQRTLNGPSTLSYRTFYSMAAHLIIFIAANKFWWILWNNPDFWTSTIILFINERGSFNKPYTQFSLLYRTDRFKHPRSQMKKCTWDSKI